MAELSGRERDMALTRARETLRIESESVAFMADRLDDVAAELDEVMFDLLREASAEGRGRPPADKRLTQARRAIEKAAQLLRAD